MESNDESIDGDVAKTTIFSETQDNFSNFAHDSIVEDYFTVPNVEDEFGEIKDGAVIGLVMYSTSGCKFCDKAKHLLSSCYPTIPVFAVDLSSNPDRWNEMKEKTGKKTVPQIFYNDCLIGGFTELNKLHNNGMLRQIEEQINKNEKHNSNNSNEELLPNSSHIDSDLTNFNDALEVGFMTMIMEEPNAATGSNSNVDISLDDFDNELFNEGKSETLVQENVNRITELTLKEEKPKALSVYDSADANTSFASSLAASSKSTDCLYSEIPFELAELYFRLREPAEDSTNTAINNVVNYFQSSPAQTKRSDTIAKPSCGLALKNKWVSYRMQFNVFKGEDLVKWLVVNKEARTKQEAQNLCKRLYSFRFFICIAQSDEDTSDVLNSLTDWEGAVRMANDVVAEIRKELLNIESKYISTTGKEVDYNAIRNSIEFHRYRLKANELQKVNLDVLSETELLSLFVNMYNILMIHGTIAYGPPTTAKERSSFFSKVAYTIGNNKYTLDDIEHGILRSNRRPPFSLMKPFGAKDPRLKYSMHILDPRIHFVLVCGAQSCPPIKIYTPATIDRGLQMAAESYCAEEVFVCLEERKVKLPKIFDWFARDFGANHVEILTFVLTFLHGSKQQELLALLQQPNKIKVTYFNYNWQVNVGVVAIEESFV